MLVFMVVTVVLGMFNVMTIPDLTEVLEVEDEAEYQILFSLI